MLLPQPEGRQRAKFGGTQKSSSSTGYLCYVSNVETISSLGENESLKRTIARLNVSEHALVGPGDDSAVISAPDGRFVVTTDTLVENHDFRLDWSTGYDLGWKAVASNIADVAAMGAVRLTAEFDLARRGETLRVERLVAAFSGAQPVADVRALQPFEFNAQSGERDFEETFVKLAFSAEERQRIRESIGVSDPSVTLVMYAPTWPRCHIYWLQGPQELENRR